MADTQTVDTSNIPTKAWGDFKSYDEANKEYVLPDEGSGYVLRIDEMSDPAPSPFKNYDEKGNEKPPRYQTMITFTIVDHQADDGMGMVGPGGKFVGQTIKQFYGISLHTKAGFYKLAKAAFGGDLDPRWKPSTELIGKFVAAVIAHKDPNTEGRVYPKVESVSVFRGDKTRYADVGVSTDNDDSDAPADDVPF